MEFRRIFRRKPKGRDRAFPITYVTSEDEIYDIVEEASEKAGINPALTYAFRRTGRIITSETRDRVPTGYLNEWEDAIDEYYELLESAKPAPGLARALSGLNEEADRIPYIFGKLLADVNERPAKRLRDMGFASLFAVFCVARTAKTFDAIRALQKSHVGEDSLTLVRSMYEGYLHIIGVRFSPDDVQNAQKAKAGLGAGTHEHRTTRKGRTDYRYVYDKVTGERLRSDVSSVRLALASPHAEDLVIFELLYSYLSRYAHPHLLALPHFIDAEGFTSKDREASTDAYVLAIIMSCLVLDAMLQFPLPVHLAKDVTRFLKFARGALTRFFDESDRLRDPAPLQRALRQRVSSLAERASVAS